MKGLHPNTLRKYADDGTIRSIRNAAGQRLFDVDSFLKSKKPSRESSRIFNPDGVCLKTYPDYSMQKRENSFLGLSSVLPKWAMHVSGEFIPLPPWEPSTYVKESGLLPTPKMADGIHPGTSTCKPGQTLHLASVVMKKRLPTPAAIDAKDNWRKSTKGGQALGYTLGVSPQFSLNPRFVETMMGFPVGWTDACCEKTSLKTGLVSPQSPVSLGSVVKRLEALRMKSKKNIANSTKSTRRLDDNIKSS